LSKNNPAGSRPAGFPVFNRPTVRAFFFLFLEIGRT
jgi:hypothetical protein